MLRVFDVDTKMFVLWALIANEKLPPQFRRSAVHSAQLGIAPILT